jgi:hypothetical protein
LTTKLGIGHEETAGEPGTPRVDHARARRVPGGLRPRAGAAGELRVLRQPDRRVGRGARRRPPQRRAPVTDPRRPADGPAHRRAGAGRDLPGPGRRGGGQLGGTRDVARAPSSPRTAAGWRPRCRTRRPPCRTCRRRADDHPQPRRHTGPDHPGAHEALAQPARLGHRVYEQLEGYTALRHALTGHPTSSSSWSSRRACAGAAGRDSRRA